LASHGQWTLASTTDPRPYRAMEHAQRGQATQESAAGGNGGQLGRDVECRTGADNGRQKHPQPQQRRDRHGRRTAETATDALSPNGTRSVQPLSFQVGSSCSSS
jgi:hypothetical protein